MSYLEKISAGPSVVAADDRSAFLSQAKNAALPAKDIEEWRKNDAEAFPWSVVENATPETRTETSINVRSGLTLDALLATPADFPKFAAMLDFETNDMDARFLAYHCAMSSPVCLRVPANTTGVVIDLVQNHTGPGLAAPATLIVVERGAEAIVHDRWKTNGSNVPLIGRTEIIVREGARLHYVNDEELDQSPAIYRMGRIHVERDGYVNWCTFTTGAPWHVAKLRLDLDGVNTEAHLSGLFSGDGQARAEHRTHQHHNTPNGFSNLLFKTLLAGEAHSIYQGIITVPQHAQKTDAYQTCRNLMLDPGTHADAIPKLEIIADDVKCSHGASIGHLNKEQMFYLQARGLNYRQALTAIATGFAEEVINTVPDELEDVQESWRTRVARTVGRASGH
ncbi:MAG: SufD family Fe-S cluster assembly protein [Calditrichaeota bacterium]|nr:SufD family Fe-S cluster assembly protein [Calditrichota bacterium]MCB9366917.1 SufD family Fe-S cluster assembly protein [Calditrichota bacterium]